MRVTFDDGDHVYDAAYVNDARWNGWLMPSFTLETVRQMAEDMNAMPAELEGVRITIHNDDSVTVHYLSTDESDTYHQLSGLYPIGAGGWCWERPAA